MNKGISTNQAGYCFENAALEDMSRFIMEEDIENAQIAAFPGWQKRLSRVSAIRQTKIPAELKAYTKA